MADVIILGLGPAGVSAALYTARAGLRTLLLGQIGGSLLKTDCIENYYGFAEPVSGKTLLENGAAQARRVGAEIVEEEAVAVSYDGKEFSVAAASGAEHRAKFLILATGSQRRAPAIKGLTEYEGRGVSYCAVCDAFFYRKRKVAVLGSGEYALHEAAELLPVAASVTVLTNGEEPAAQFAPETPVEKRKIAELFGEGTLKGVRFEDGSVLETAGVFVAVGVAGSVDLARKLGAETKGTAVVVDENRRTSIPGLYAAGDCIGGLMQISKSVCDGAVAGTSVVKAFRQAAKCCAMPLAK